MNQGFLYIRKNDFHIEKLFDELIHFPWSENQFQPHFDLFETSDEYIFEADCPGMTIQDIHLNIRNNLLIISGERTLNSGIDFGNFRFRERMHGKFIRTIELPVDANREDIHAEMNHGVLQVKLMKLKDQ